ncbi:MAG: DUF6036 family nucleotidyltransferase [Bryobacteraceae bacterium]|nr:DUF6036 family nucleotidyltransferase [Bryobacteraceae bacterium]
MPHESPSEPWLSFLNDVDAALDERTELHCMGGFAIMQAYGFDRATVDIDVLSVVPYSSGASLLKLAGKESLLRTEHAIYVDVVTVATAPEEYATRVVPLCPGHWERLNLYVLEAHDLALTKLERNFERDRADVAYLASAGFLKPAILRERYFKELRPYIHGRKSWHDRTLELWLEAYFPIDNRLGPGASNRE